MQLGMYFTLSLSTLNFICRFITHSLCSLKSFCSFLQPPLDMTVLNYFLHQKMSLCYLLPFLHHL